jgi:cytochrome b involved in lipid metabolism
MDIKKELITGIVGTIAIIGLTGYYVTTYNTPPQRTVPVARAPSVKPAVILTTSEIAKHNSSSDCWIIVTNTVYSVTSYLSLHPDGGKIILPYCGSDATTAFETKDGRGVHSSRAREDLLSLKLGTVNEPIQASPRVQAPARGTNVKDEGEEDEDE